MYWIALVSILKKTSALWILRRDIFRDARIATTPSSMCISRGARESKCFIWYVETWLAMSASKIKRAVSVGARRLLALFENLPDEALKHQIPGAAQASSPDALSTTSIDCAHARTLSIYFASPAATTSAAVNVHRTRCP